jgi:predicted dehydrogenase
MPSINRRDFLHDSAALAAALAGTATLTGSAAAQQPRTRAERNKGSAIDKLRVAIVGVHGRGMSHVGGFAAKNNCVVTTICDCDEAVVGKAIKAVAKAQGIAPKYEKDIRKVVADKDVDIVSIATPNHWHALAAIWAIQNGKDVYVEKPVSHNVSEGRRIVEAARKYNRICQTGTQCRSMPATREAMKFLHDGKLGKITLGYGLCYKARPSIGRVSGPQQPPSSMDYDLWCGPAPNKPPHRNGKFGPVHYDWHWIWDYGNGDLGNQGIHQMDVARWGLKKNELAGSVQSVGGRFGYIDDGETANTQIAAFDYGDCELIFEVRGLPTKHYKGAKVGNVFVGSKGYLVCPSYNSAVAYDPDGQILQVFKEGGDENHYENFVNAVRSRKAEELNADILEGHLSSALCHLANISYRLGQLCPFSKQTGVFGDDKTAVEALARTAEHLKDNKVPLEQTSYRLGRKLTMDPKAEKFIQDTEANQYLSREYRKGFEVPDKI